MNEEKVNAMNEINKLKMQLAKADKNEEKNNMELKNAQD